MKRMLLLFVVACGGSSPVGPDSAPEPDTSPEPDAAGMQYSVLYTRWNDGPEIVAGGLQGEILPLRRLDGGVVLASQAAVSPNGMRMAFTSFSYASSTWDLIVRPIAGTEADELVLAKTTGGAALPAWSHDGTRIAFVSFAEDSMYGVYVVCSPRSGSTMRIKRRASRHTGHPMTPKSRSRRSTASRPTSSPATP